MSAVDPIREQHQSFLADLAAVQSRAERHMDMHHRDGVKWFDAPLPRRLHRCTEWSSAWLGFTRVKRCACGGISRNGSRFWERNSRRKS